MPRVASNIPQDPLRWSVLRAAEEFDIDQVTLRKRLVKADEQPGEDACYSTQQIIGSIFDSSKALRDREVKAKAEHWEIRNSVLKGELLDRQDTTRSLEQSYAVIKQIVNASSLPKKDKKDILDSVASYPVIIEGVVRRQSSQVKKGEDSGET
jgi:hypothetical protein